LYPGGESFFSLKHDIKRIAVVVHISEGGKNIMDNHLVNFDMLEWTIPAKGIRFKKYTNGRHVIRLLEFSEGFIEEEYCANGHASFLLEGSLSVEYNGSLEHYNAGDVVFIPAGKENRHKAIISMGQKALLLMFETEKCLPDAIDYCI